jgi:hypothetical protein
MTLDELRKLKERVQDNPKYIVFAASEQQILALLELAEAQLGNRTDTAEPAANFDGRPDCMEATFAGVYPS